MLAKISSCSLQGIDGFPVTVEADIANGLPAFEIVGLPDMAVREARERVRAAIKNSGFEFPLKRITINLAPADLKKEGPGFDLPMAVAILAASEQIRCPELDQMAFIGELSLDGTITPVNGVLSMTMEFARQGGKTMVVGSDNAGEAALVPDVRVIPVNNLYTVVQYLNGEQDVTPFICDIEEYWNGNQQYSDDFAEVKGQKLVKRALEIAVAGGHNALIIGPPGSGKTMLARRVPTIMPPLSLQEALEVTKIHSVAGLLERKTALVTQRQFRAPHHTVSDAGLIGGGRLPHPGEISLSHHGVLFLDELPEFDKHVLEVLRQPLEDGVVTISRVHGSSTYPCKFFLLASMNPCPCGFLGDPVRRCSCSPRQIQRYLAKISGPLLDRIDLHVEAPRVEYQQLAGQESEERSKTIRTRVMHARQVQLERFAKQGIYYNSQMQRRHITSYCSLSPDGQQLLQAAFTRLGMSARVHDRVLKVSRTIADLEGEQQILARHVAEAIQYRTLDRKLWE